MIKVILGLMAIVAVLVVAVSFIAHTIFERAVAAEVKELYNSNVKGEDKVIRETDLAGLPLCVQKWLKYAQVIGKEKISTVRLKQQGKMRTGQGQPWKPVKAEQYFTVDKPGFIWKASIKFAPMIKIAGRDKYYEGKGNMLIKLLSIITVADAAGKEVDQGTLVRYLAETVWFPTAALNSYIKWEEIDTNTAKATMSFNGVTATGAFVFNEKGEVVNFIAERYMEKDGQYSLETWSTPMKDYKEFNGIRIPTKGEVIWKLEEGDFNWYQFEITEVEYNIPLIY